MDTINKKPETIKDRTPSTTYTLKSFKNAITKMNKLKMLKEDEYKTLVKLNNDIVSRWISIGMTLQ